MQLNPIKKRSMKMMTHRGRILRFLIKLTNKTIICFLTFQAIS